MSTPPIAIVPALGLSMPAWSLLWFLLLGMLVLVAAFGRRRGI